MEAAGMLSKLVSCPEGKASLLKANSIPVLVNIVRSGSMECKVSANMKVDLFDRSQYFWAWRRCV